MFFAYIYLYCCVFYSYRVELYLVYQFHSLCIIAHNYCFLKKKNKKKNSEPFCVSNCVNYVAYVACARIDKSSILAYVRKET